MVNYLLDTNICIYFLRGKEGIDVKINKIGAENCFISEITVAELLYGVEYSSKNEKENRKLLTLAQVCDLCQRRAVKNGKAFRR